jgi:arylsulfatase A-like enzyme
LIIHLPHQTEGKRVNCNAEQADLAPTILDLLGHPDLGSFDGESLTKAMFADYLSDKPKYSMNLENNNPGVAGVLQTRAIAVIKNHYKYIYYIDKDLSELYDLSHDPKENNDLIKQNREVAESLKSLIPRDILKK